MLNAKDIQMILTKFLFKALYTLIEELTKGYGSIEVGIKHQIFKINCQELTWDCHIHHLLPNLHAEDSRSESGKGESKITVLAGLGLVASQIRVLFSCVIG